MAQKRVFLITSNPGKVDSLNAILADAQLPVTIEAMAGRYPEDKSEETCEHVAREGARHCATTYTQPVLVTDTGIFIEALEGFPGVNTKFTLERIGIDGILRLMRDVPDRSVVWRLALGFAAPDMDARVFTAELTGSIPVEARGTDGFGFDSIFIPDGYEETLAEDVALRDNVSPFRAALVSFARWYVDQPESTAKLSG